MRKLYSLAAFACLATLGMLALPAGAEAQSCQTGSGQSWECPDNELPSGFAPVSGTIDGEPISGSSWVNNYDLGSIGCSAYTPGESEGTVHACSLVESATTRPLPVDCYFNGRINGQQTCRQTTPDGPVFLRRNEDGPGWRQVFPSS